MPVTVQIPSYLAGFAGGRSSFPVEGAPRTVRDLLDAIWRIHPGLRDRIVDEQGEIRQHVNLFVGGEAIRLTGGLETPVDDRAEVLIVPAVSGG